MELLIKNGMIIDGTGAPAYKGNVGVENGKLKVNVCDETADVVIDAEGASNVNAEGIDVKLNVVEYAPKNSADKDENIYFTPKKGTKLRLLKQKSKGHIHTAELYTVTPSDLLF